MPISPEPRNDRRREAGWLEIRGILAEDATLFLATASPSDQKVFLHRIAQMQDDVRR